MQVCCHLACESCSKGQHDNSHNDAINRERRESTPAHPRHEPGDAGIGYNKRDHESDRQDQPLFGGNLRDANRILALARAATSAACSRWRRPWWELKGKRKTPERTRATFRPVARRRWLPSNARFRERLQTGSGRLRSRWTGQGSSLPFSRCGSDYPARPALPSPRAPSWRRRSTSRCRRSAGTRP